MRLSDYARVGRFLVRDGKITGRQLRQALAEQERRRARGVSHMLGAICVELGFCSSADVSAAIERRRQALLERPATTAPALEAFRKCTDSVRLAANQIAHA